LEPQEAREGRRRQRSRAKSLEATIERADRLMVPGSRGKSVDVGQSGDSTGRLGKSPPSPPARRPCAPSTMDECLQHRTSHPQTPGSTVLGNQRRPVSSWPPTKQQNASFSPFWCARQGTQQDSKPPSKPPSSDRDGCRPTWGMLCSPGRGRHRDTRRNSARLTQLESASPPLIGAESRLPSPATRWAQTINRRIRRG
jgi:hypothetical protein